MDLVAETHKLVFSKNKIIVACLLKLANVRGGVCIGVGKEGKGEKEEEEKEGKGEKSKGGKGGKKARACRLNNNNVFNVPIIGNNNVFGK